MQLLRVTHNIEAKFNLIVFNPHQGTRFRASTHEAVAAFRSVLIQGGRVCTVRDSRGDDQVGSCEGLCMYSMILYTLLVQTPSWGCMNTHHLGIHNHTRIPIYIQMAACGQLGNLEVTAAAGRTPAPILDPPASYAHVFDVDSGETITAQI